MRVDDQKRAGQRVEDWSQDFGPFDGRAWLNTAHQGPLPRVAARALQEAVDDKRAPHRISDEAFVELPMRLRTALATLIGAQPDEIVLGNSASWGLQTIANAFPWEPGDEVAVLATDYPPTIYPWLVIERRGVSVKRIRPAGPVVDLDALVDQMSDRTRILCVSWVNSYTGSRLDLVRLTSACRTLGIRLVINATQGIGAIPFSVADLEVDAISASGFKWLCGPYSTGFAWLRPDLMDTLQPTQAYWLAQPPGGKLDLNRAPEPELRMDLGARAFDVFGTANFFNFVPWLASLDYLNGLGINAAAEHDQLLIDRFLARLDTERFRLVSPRWANDRSAIVAFDDLHQPAERTVADLAAIGVDVALRGGHIRVSPHVHNTVDDIDRLLEGLNAP
jgi:cysteine desulfurase / selenocysteine lyase